MSSADALSESYLLLRARILRELEAFLGREAALQELQDWLALGLGLDRAALAARGREAASAVELRRVRGWLARRRKGEPFLQILGWVPFCGRRFRIDRHVMIPRAHSEAAARAALAWARELDAKACVDVGTGCGNLGITLALERAWCVTATELCPKALAVARANARALGADVDFRLGHLLDPATGPLDLVVANLPYVDPGRGAELEDVFAFEPELAMLSPGSGTGLNAELLHQAHAKGARACLLEHGPGQGAALQQAAREAGWTSVRLQKDSLREDHLLFAWRDGAAPAGTLAP